MHKHRDAHGRCTGTLELFGQDWGKSESEQVRCLCSQKKSRYLLQYMCFQLFEESLYVLLLVKRCKWRTLCIFKEKFILLLAGLAVNKQKPRSKQKNLQQTTHPKSQVSNKTESYEYALSVRKMLETIF